MWNDAQYAYNYSVNELNQAWEIGDELGVVTYMMNDHAGADHIMKNGHATYLSPGTKLYAMAGYDPVFRIIADGNVYEVNDPAEADILGDFLDIEGKVESIWFLSDYDESPLFPMSSDITGKFIDEFLNLDFVPFYEISNLKDGNRTFIEFRLTDGTSMRTVFWIESKVFSSGAIGTDQIQETIEKELLIHAD